MPPQQPFPAPPPPKKKWPRYFTLTLTNDLDFGSKERVLHQGISMWNMKALITYHSKAIANAKKRLPWTCYEHKSPVRMNSDVKYEGHMSYHSKVMYKFCIWPWKLTMTLNLVQTERSCHKDSYQSKYLASIFFSFSFCLMKLILKIDLDQADDIELVTNWKVLSKGILMWKMKALLPIKRYGQCKSSVEKQTDRPKTICPRSIHAGA